MMHTVSRFEGECALILLDFFFKKENKDYFPVHYFPTITN